MNFLILLLVTVVTTALPNHEVVLQEFVEANNLFAASFYKEIGQTRKNSFLISPYSAEAVLAFLQSGCKNETAQEIRSILHLPDDQAKVESLVESSISALQGNDLYTLSTANKLYIRENFPVKEEFLKTATKIYHSDIENINFALKEIAAKTMNTWVENQTNSKIKNLVNPDILNPDIVSILINAVHFKGNWTYNFIVDDTRKKPFYKTQVDAVEVDTMHLDKAWFNYHESSELEAKFLEMPFKGERASMTIVLPNKKDGLDALEHQIEKVFAAQNFKTETMSVQLPKFKIESRLPLSETLTNMGVKKIFDPQQADLSGIAGVKGDLVVDSVLQKTYINVEEGGVEAATGTYVAVSLRCGCEPEPIPFVADHPFIFYIKVKDFIIFAGRYSGPL